MKLSQILEAIRNFDIEKIKNSIDRGIELNPNADLTPLGLAAELGNSEMVNLLIERGANVNLTMDDEEGTTALMMAAAAGNFEVTKILVESGADPNIKDCYGEHALAIAARNAHEEIFNYLDPLTSPKWEPGDRVLEQAKRAKRMRNRKGVWVEVFNTDSDIKTTNTK